MKKILKFTHSIYYILYIQAKKYNNEIISNDISSFVFSMYLLLFSLIILFILDFIFDCILQDNSVSKIIIISISGISLAISLIYFRYKKDILKYTPHFQIVLITEINYFGSLFGSI